MPVCTIEPLDEATVDDIIARCGNGAGSTLTILEQLQNRHPHRYLPESTLALVARKTRVPPSRVMSVATFYSFFNLQPQGRHTVMACRGTACHTRGSKRLLDILKHVFGHRGRDEQESFTTADYRVTVRTVACFGQCALAPVVAVDDKIYGHVTEIRLREILRSIEEHDEHHEDPES